MPEVVRQDFNLTYPELITLCNTVHTFMIRDAAEFLANFGITALITAAFDTKINEFEVYPTDETLLGLAQQTTQDKDAIANNVRIKIRSIAIRAKNVFGENSGTYSAFGVKDMNNFDDGNLLACGRRVAQMAETYLTQLTPEGLTQDIIDDLLDICNSFEDAGQAQKLAIANRADTAKVRVDMANELYRLLVKYCDYGKDIWFNINQAKYNCYIIYQPSAGSLAPPTDLYFNFPTKTFSWSEIEHATSYRLLCASDLVNFIEIYSGPDTFAIYEPTTFGNSAYKCQGRNSNGFGPESETLIQGYYITLPPPINLHVELLVGTTNTIKLTFNAVPSATKYKIYRSTANIGDIAGSFVYADTVYDNEFMETLDSGHRYYYRCTAENNHQTSTNSSQVWIEI